jgi:hypothetical protein
MVDLYTRNPGLARRMVRNVLRSLASVTLVALVLASPGLPAALSGTPSPEAPGSVALASTTPPGTSPTNGPIPVYLDGLVVEFDVPPKLIDDRALVPFRFLAEALGCDVEWDSDARKVTAVDRYTGRTVVLLVDNTEATVNGEVRHLDVPARIIDDRTLIPLRFFGEALDAKVDWINETRTITVVSPRRPMTALGYYALGGVNETSWQSLFGAPYPNVAGGATDVFSEIACAWFVLDPATGRIELNDRHTMQVRPASWRDVLTQATQHNIATEMMIFGSNWEGQLDRFLTDTAAMQRTVLEIADYAADFRGVHLDLEYLGRGQTGEDLEITRQRFNTFVRVLSTTLRSRGKTLTVCLHAPNTWFRGYDYKTLGEMADQVVIMAYIYNQGPQALDKVAEAIDLALELVPREKLLLGLLVGRNNTYETAESLAVKIGLVKRRGLAGIALWSLSALDPDRAEAIRQTVLRPSGVNSP